MFWLLFPITRLWFMNTKNSDGKSLLHEQLVFPADPSTSLRLAPRQMLYHRLQPVSRGMVHSYDPEMANASHRGPGRGPPGWSAEGSAVPCCLWPTQSWGVFMGSREMSTMWALWLDHRCRNSCAAPSGFPVTLAWEVGGPTTRGHQKWEARMLSDPAHEVHTPGISCALQKTIAPVTCHVWKPTCDTFGSVPLS